MHQPASMLERPALVANVTMVVQDLVGRLLTEGCRQLRTSRCDHSLAPMWRLDLVASHMLSARLPQRQLHRCKWPRSTLVPRLLLARLLTVHLPRPRWPQAP